MSLAQLWLRHFHFHELRPRYFLQLFFPVVKKCFPQAPRPAKRGRTLPAFFLLCNEAAPLHVLFRLVHARSLPLPARGGKMRFRYRSPRMYFITGLGSAPSGSLSFEKSAL